jgi:peroxin-4
MLATKRLRKELQALHNNQDEFIYLLNDPNNILIWNATIIGPKSSVYEGFKFKLGIQVTSDYPHIPPTINFQTRIFHPNVSTTGTNLDLLTFYLSYWYIGEICLDILKKEWSPAWTLQAACRAIMLLLENPEVS